MRNLREFSLSAALEGRTITGPETWSVNKNPGAITSVFSESIALMPPSKDLRANVLKAIETDFERVLKSHAGPINEDLVAYRRRRCRRFNHLLRKDMQCYSGTSDDGRWFIEVLFPFSPKPVIPQSDRFAVPTYSSRGYSG